MRQPAARRRGGDNQKGKDKPAKKATSTTGKKKEAKQPRQLQKKPGQEDIASLYPAVDLPIPLQQLLLNIFRTAFVVWPATRTDPDSDSDTASTSLTQHIQTLKTHLYRRDFASAFTDAKGDLLRAYALRWSAGRSLGYAGIFEGIFAQLCCRKADDDDGGLSMSGRYVDNQHVLCIGGGAGAEVVALAAVMRTLKDGATVKKRSSSSSTTASSSSISSTDLSKKVLDLALDNILATPTTTTTEDPQVVTANPLSEESTAAAFQLVPNLSVTAVDIADWNPVISGLADAIVSDSVPSTKTCSSPLVKHANAGVHFSVSFQKEDVLSLSEEKLGVLLCSEKEDANAELKLPSSLKDRPKTTLVTLMFTLNELISTSMPKTVGLLLKITDLVLPGTILLVVDSPGSYSTLSVGSKGNASSTENSEGDSQGSSGGKKYPMRFLLQHSLLSAGRWECLLSDESRWFRRDRAALKYDLGDGIGLEDMRYQIHIYRRTGEK